MSFQLRAPGDIPGHHDLEMIATDSHTSVMSYLDTQLGFPESDFDVELSAESALKQYAEYIGGIMTSNIRYSDTDKAAINAVAPKAMTLSVAISAALLGRTDFEPDTQCISQFKDNFPGLINFLQYAPFSYFNRRPTLSHLTERYVGMFSNSQAEHNRATDLCGLGLLQVDDHIAKNHFIRLDQLASLEASRLDYELFDILSDGN